GRGGAGDSGRRRVLSEAEEEGERSLHLAKMQRAMEMEASGVEDEVMAELEETLPESFRRMRDADNPSSFFESLPLEEQKEVTDWKERQQQMMEGLRQKAMEERLRGMDGVDRRVRQLITLRVACVCPHIDAASRTGPRTSAVKPSPSSSLSAPAASLAAATAAAAPAAAPAECEGGEAVESAPQRRRPGEADTTRLGCGEPSLPRGRRHALPPMVAVLKVWAPNEATAALLLEGAELRLHSVTATTCHHHIPGCSLELSAGRQTKIELINSPPGAASSAGAPAGKKAAVAGQNPGVDQRPPVQRFVPRCRTPLSALAPRGSDFEEAGGDGRTGGSGVGSGGEERPVPAWTSMATPEVDLVGCVLGVTVEHPPASSSCSTTEEVFVTAESIARGNPGGGGGG
ncbi:unnamed protein product, partial [Scytosiphon promiscuus]